MLNNYSVIFWDFDGVLMNSNAVRDQGFVEVLKEYPKSQVNLMLDFHRKNGGLSRYVKFRYFFESVRKEQFTEEKMYSLTQSFSEIMRKLLVNPNLLIADSVDFVKTNFNRYKMHIVSGSDQSELRYLTDKLEIKKYFQSIHGSPTPKCELIKNIILTNHYNPSSCCMIGDSINDYEAAKENNIGFIAYNNAELHQLDQKIISFNDLPIF